MKEKKQKKDKKGKQDGEVKEKKEKKEDKESKPKDDKEKKKDKKDKELGKDKENKDKKDKSAKAEVPSSSRPAPVRAPPVKKGPPAKTDDYLAGLDLPPSDDEDEYERTEEIVKGPLDVKVSDRETKKLADKARTLHEQSIRAKEQALREDENVFDVSYEGMGSDEATVSATDVKVSLVLKTGHVGNFPATMSSVLGA